MNLIPLLQQAGGSGNYIPLIGFGIVFIIFYVLIFAPQKREQKKMQEMIAGIQKGDVIVTIGGIHGVVSSVKENSIILKVDDNCKIEMSRSSIAHIVLDEKSKAARQNAVPEKTSRFSWFGVKNKKEEPEHTGKPKPPNFGSGTV
ncbi:MAG: preprotein translocase subunit YajC [Treponema sp.]